MGRKKKIISTVTTEPVKEQLNTKALWYFAYYLRSSTQTDIQILLDALVALEIEEVETLDTKGTWCGTLCRVKIVDLDSAMSRSEKGKITKTYMAGNWIRYEVYVGEERYVFRTDQMSQGIWQIFSVAKEGVKSE